MSTDLFFCSMYCLKCKALRVAVLCTGDFSACSRSFLGPLDHVLNADLYKRSNFEALWLLSVEENKAQ